MAAQKHRGHAQLNKTLPKLIFWGRTRNVRTNFCHKTQGVSEMTSKKPNIAIIIGSTRPTRFADKPAQWILSQAKARNDMDVELVDLRDYPLPFFDEAASNKWMPSKGAEALRWQKKLAEFDGFIFVLAEYNHSIPGVLKNALDQAYNEWNKKPMSAMAYGSMGAARAMEHLRLIAVELDMVPVHGAVHLGGADMFKVHPMGGGDGDFSKIEANMLPAAKAMFDDIVWWANATMAARSEEAAKAA
jgi:NAD(P)H-dependent FMN reductase